MDQRNLKQSLLAGKAPKQIRMLIAGGMAPIPSGELLELLILLLKDSDPEVGARAAESIRGWDQEEIRTLLSAPGCHPSILEYFSQAAPSDRLLRAILSNPSSSDMLIASLAQTVPAHLLETILDNRVRIIKHPVILASIRQNPASTPETLRLVREIEVEFLEGKKRSMPSERLLRRNPSSPPLWIFNCSPLPKICRLRACRKTRRRARLRS